MRLKLKALYVELVPASKGQHCYTVNGILSVMRYLPNLQVGFFHCFFLGGEGVVFSLCKPKLALNL